MQVISDLPQKSRILLIEDEPAHAHLIADSLRRINHEVENVSTGMDAFSVLSSETYDLIILDLGLPDMSGMSVLNWIRGRDDSTPIIFVTVEDGIDRGVEAMRRGATNYVVKRSGYLDRVAKAAREALKLPRKSVPQQPAGVSGEIVGVSPAMEEVRGLIEEYAASDATVIIQGETGTGKELVATAIHRESPLASGPFLPVNCSAIPEHLLENEFFGHVRGAFTGADRDRSGVLEAAHNGTLFLDEIAELPLRLQGKLLRFLESGAFRPLGATADTRADARVIAATNQNLRKLTEEKKFRADLFFRLDVLWIHLPPLRERREDILALVNHFLERYAPGEQREITREAIAQLMVATWPGNVRELEHAVQRTVLHSVTGPIHLFDVEPGTAPRVSRDKIERERLVRLLVRHQGRLGPVAERLGVSVRTVQRRMVRCGLSRRDFLSAENS